MRFKNDIIKILNEFDIPNAMMEHSTVSALVKRECRSAAESLLVRRFREFHFAAAGLNAAVN